MNALTRSDILELLKELNEKLKGEDIHGEMYIFGGAVMAIEYHTRLSTKDIDAVFEPKSRIYEIALRLSLEKGLDKGWLNDGVKGFISPAGSHKVLAEFSNLTIWSPSTEYLLAMKCLSARADGDFEDIKVLMKVAGVIKTDDVMDIVEKYYPANRIKINTRYLVLAAEEEIRKEEAGHVNDKEHNPG